MLKEKLGCSRGLCGKVVSSMMISLLHLYHLVCSSYMPEVPTSSQRGCRVSESQGTLVQPSVFVF